MAVAAQSASVLPTALPLAATVDRYHDVANPDGTSRPGQRPTAHQVLKSGREQDTLPWSAVIHDIYGGQRVFEQIESA